MGFNSGEQVGEFNNKICIGLPVGPGTFYKNTPGHYYNTSFVWMYHDKLKCQRGGSNKTLRLL